MKTLKIITSLYILFFITVIAVSTASATSNYSATVNTKPMLEGSFISINTVNQGDHIFIKLKIDVDPSSDVIPAAYLYIEVTPPSGNSHVLEGPSEQIYQFQPESSWTINVQTGIVADEEGTWSVYVEFWDYYHTVKIDDCTGTFEVSGGGGDQYIANISIVEISGYILSSVAALSIAAVGYKLGALL